MRKIYSFIKSFTAVAKKEKNVLDLQIVLNLNPYLQKQDGLGLQYVKDYPFLQNWDQASPEIMIP